MSDTQHIILVIADSLRYDSVWDGEESHAPWLQSHATTFRHAYSSGCWTLPSHASLFTGMLPHEHGATTRSRGLNESIPTLAEQMKARGYQTVQLTANAVTTHIFGLDRGFDRVERVWRSVAPGNLPISNFFVLAGKRRIRNRFLKGDFITGKMTEDIQAGQAWVKSLGNLQFEKAEQILREADQAGEKVFLFLNLMETHFPYHIGRKFRILSSGLLNKLREMKSLFHLVNQSWLSNDKEYFRPRMLSVLRRRQRLAWKWFSRQVDAFSESVRSTYPNALYVFTSDHGDNFGDEGWKYHFSNVTEAGNRVPLFISGPGIDEDRIVTDPISIRHLYSLFLQAANGTPGPETLRAEESIDAILESFWYNKSGRTLEKYQSDQFAFIHETTRYVQNGDGWHAFTLGNGDSAAVEELPYSANPVYDLELAPEQRDRLIAKYEHFTRFSEDL